VDAKERHAGRFNAWFERCNLTTALRKKVFGLNLDRQLMLDVQHLSLDQDRYVNDMIEEAGKNLLK